LPRRSFAYAPKADDPATWKLPYLTAEGEPDPEHLPNAAAAVSAGGFRGQRANIPAAAERSVKAKLRQAYRRWGKGDEEMPESIREADPWALLDEQIIDLAEGDDSASQRAAAPPLAAARDIPGEPGYVAELLADDLGVTVEHAEALREAAAGADWQPAYVAELAEGTDDHPYGAWQGGSKASGGRPGRAGGSAVGKGERPPGAGGTQIGRGERQAPGTDLSHRPLRQGAGKGAGTERWWSASGGWKTSRKLSTGEEVQVRWPGNSAGREWGTAKVLGTVPGADGHYRVAFLGPEAAYTRNNGPSIVPRSNIRPLREASDDHPYGSWAGGSKASGGRPAGKGGGGAAKPERAPQMTGKGSSEWNRGQSAQRKPRAQLSRDVRVSGKSGDLRVGRKGTVTQFNQRPSADIKADIAKLKAAGETGVRLQRAQAELRQATATLNARARAMVDANGGSITLAQAKRALLAREKPQTGSIFRFK
jgi:hypothetical protein